MSHKGIGIERGIDLGRGVGEGVGVGVVRGGAVVWLDSRTEEEARLGGAGVEIWLDKGTGGDSFMLSLPPHI